MVSLHPRRDRLQAKDRQDGLQSLPSLAARSDWSLTTTPRGAPALGDPRVQGNRAGDRGAFPHPGAGIVREAQVDRGRPEAAATTARRCRTAAPPPLRCSDMAPPWTWNGLRTRVRASVPELRWLRGISGRMRRK
jgi:hypothetical protein